MLKYDVIGYFINCWQIILMINLLIIKVMWENLFIGVGNKHGGLWFKFVSCFQSIVVDVIWSVL